MNRSTSRHCPRPASVLGAPVFADLAVSKSLERVRTPGAYGWVFLALLVPDGT